VVQSYSDAMFLLVQLESVWVVLGWPLEPKILDAVEKIDGSGGEAIADELPEHLENEVAAEHVVVFLVQESCEIVLRLELFEVDVDFELLANTAECGRYHVVGGQAAHGEVAALVLANDFCEEEKNQFAVLCGKDLAL
jgi:hypothetical protein